MNVHKFKQTVESQSLVTEKQGIGDKKRERRYKELKHQQVSL